MTEDEAKTRWCPFARVAGTGSEWPASNRVNLDDGAVPQNSKCFGSDCMAWRWGPPSHYEGAVFVEGDVVQRGRPAPSGYCGLAGGEG